MYWGSAVNGRAGATISGPFLLPLDFGPFSAGIVSRDRRGWRCCVGEARLGRSPAERSLSSRKLGFKDAGLLGRSPTPPTHPQPLLPKLPVTCKLFGAAERSSAHFVWRALFSNAVQSGAAHRAAPRTAALPHKNGGIKPERDSFEGGGGSAEAASRATEETDGFGPELSGRKRASGRAPTESSVAAAADPPPTLQAPPG
jgi:hypothetical protein